MPVEFLTDAKAGAYGPIPCDCVGCAAGRVLPRRGRRGGDPRAAHGPQPPRIRNPARHGAIPGDFRCGSGARPTSGCRATWAAQLGIDDLSALERYWDSQTRWDHQAEIRRRYRYQPFGQAPTHLPFLRGLFGRAWLADERPTVLCDRATAYLLEHKILLPGVTTLARLVAAVRERAKRRLWKQLAARVDRSTAKRLESLLMVPEGSSQSTLESLRRGPVRASGAGLVDAICRVEQIRELGVADFDLAGLPEAAVRRLARYTAGAGERGQLRQKYREGQEDQLSALGLVVNIVALWNTIYCQAALDRLRSAGIRSGDCGHRKALAARTQAHQLPWAAQGQPRLDPSAGELRPLHGA